jgi:hypothetical protein
MDQDGQSETLNQRVVGLAPLSVTPLAYPLVRLLHSCIGQPPISRALLT